MESSSIFTGFVDHNLKPSTGHSSPTKHKPALCSSSELDDALKLADRKKIKKFLRTNQWPVCHEVRQGLWGKLCTAGQGRNHIQPKTVYNEVVQEVIGEELAPDAFGKGDREHALPLPTFVDSCHLERYYLSETGVWAARKLLTVIAHDQPDILYCPLLFPLTCLLLHYLDEQGTYDCINFIINSKEKYLTQTRSAYEASTLALKEMTRKYAKPCYQNMVKRTPEINPILENWSWWIMKDLPFAYIVRVVDCFLFEGPKVLYRIALAILIHYAKQSAKSSHSGMGSGDLMKEIKQFCEDIPVSCSKLLKTAFGIRGLSRSEIKKLIVKNEIYTLSKINALRIQAAMPVSPSAGSLSLLVSKETGSNIVTKKDWRDIYSWLPARIAINQPKLIFSTAEHGTSLSTFYNRVEGYEPTFIAIKTSKHETFGAYCSVDWVERKGKQRVFQYFGTGESFICTLTPKKIKYSWVGVRLADKTPNSAHQFMSGDSLHFSIGGGNGTAIFVDENLLNGVTEHCDTFDNPPLLDGGMFKIAVLEVFAFEFCS